MRRSSSHRVNLSRLAVNLKLTLGLLVAILIMAGTLVFLSKLNITSIICQVENQFCQDEVQQQLQPLIGRSIFFSDLETDVGQQLKDQPFKLKMLRKRLPNQLIIKIEPIEPIYNIRLGETTRAVDVAGNVQPQSITDLPIVIVEPNCPLINSAWQINLTYHSQLIGFWQTLHEKHLAINELKCLSPDTVVIKIPDQPKFILHPDSLTLQAQKLSILIESLKFDTFTPIIQEVDLRFNQPVLREQITIDG